MVRWVAAGSNATIGDASVAALIEDEDSAASVALRAASGTYSGARTWTGDHVFIAAPEVHAQSNDATPVFARTVDDGKTVGNWNVIHDGAAGDVLHFTTGPNSSTRTVTDLATTSGSAVITSATAAFTTGSSVIAGVGTDVGKTVAGTGIPAGATIVSVQSATQATISANATATATGVTAVIGAGNANGAVIAIGIDHGGTGLALVNKWRGVGLNIRQRETVANSASYGMLVLQESGVATAAAFRMNAGVSGAKAAVASFDVFGGDAPADTSLVAFNANSVGGSTRAGRVMADTGVLAWSRTIQAVASNSSVTPLIRVADEATTPSEVYMTAKTAAATGLRFYRNAGSGTLTFGSAIEMESDRLKIKAGNGAQNKGAETMSTVMEVRATGTGQVGFFGSVSAKRTATADATDLATAITLVNALKADLVAFGLKTA